MLMSGIYLIIYLSSRKQISAFSEMLKHSFKKKERKIKPNTALLFSRKIRDTYLYNRISQGSQSQGCEFSVRMI